MITLLEFEPAYVKVTIQLFYHYAPGIPHKIIVKMICIR